MNMDFKARLVHEMLEVSERLSKLNMFLDSENFNALDDINKMLLSVQRDTMKAYVSVLEARVSILL